MNHKAEMSLFAQNHTLHKDALPQDFVCTTTHLHTVFYAALSQTIPACSNSNIQNVSLKTCMLSLHLDPMFLTCFHGTLGIARLYHPLKHNQKLSSFNMTSIPSNAMSLFYHHICVSVGGVHVNTVCVCVCVCACAWWERESVCTGCWSTHVDWFACICLLDLFLCFYDLYVNGISGSACCMTECL